MNIKTLAMATALVPAVAFAQEAATTNDTTYTQKPTVVTNTHDTTFVFNRQKFDISQNGERTNVRVYKKNGTEMKKVKETEFLDGQEVEQVYITSPFIPRNTYKRRSQAYSHYPMFYLGMNTLPGSAFGISSESKYSRDSKSTEFGFNVFSFEFPLSSSLAVTSAMSLVFVNHHFKTDYVLNTVDGVTSLQPFKGEENDDERPSKSYLNYWAVRIPVMLEWSNRIGSEDLYAAFGPSIELRNGERSRYKLGKKHTLTKDVNMNSVGINLEARLGYGFFMLYARTSLTPLLRTKYAPEWHPFTVGFGVRF